MKKENSKSLEMDWRSIKSIIEKAFAMIVVFYATNTEAINTILQKYMNPDIFAIVVLILAYIVRKYVTDYSK